MRLICGIYQLDGAHAAEDRLRAMIAQMDVPRLRPSVRLWREGPVALAVLDFSARGRVASALPERAGSIMAADVRLDQPAELRRAVGAAASVAEDALLLAALETYGPAGLDRVLGDFAFASWNRSTQRLLCGRDAFGIRPFAYVYQRGKLFAFASFPKALHGSGIVDKEIDEDALARRLVLALRSDDCLVAGINRLPSAHVLEVTREGVSVVRYWQLDRAAVGSRNYSPEAAARQLRLLMDEAVKCRLPREGEIGAHLSGGLDSSAISVLAARSLRDTGRTLHAYSFLERQRNDITLEDETEFVNAVLAQESDIDWTPVRPPAAMFAFAQTLDPDKMTPLESEDPENAVCARAEEQGVGLVLSGWGGDEAATFNGRGAFAELFLRGRWRTLAREVSALKRERGWSVPHILYGEIVAYLLPESITALAKRIVGRDPGLQALMRQSLSATARRRLAAFRDQALRMTADGCENRWRLITSPHIAERAEVWAQTGARHGLAFAFPLLDRRVVEFSLSLPSELFLRGGFRRRPFRDAMADVLPGRVRLRHQKYQPFPGGIIDIAECKQQSLAQLDAYSQNESVRRLVDLVALRCQIEASPSPDRLREELRANENSIASSASMLAAQRALLVASYLDQHGRDGGACAKQAE